MAKPPAETSVPCQHGLRSSNCYHTDFALGFCCTISRSRIDNFQIVQGTTRQAIILSGNEIGQFIAANAAGRANASTENRTMGMMVAIKPNRTMIAEKG